MKPEEMFGDYIDVEDLKSDHKDKYAVEVKCENCGYEKHFLIPYGRSVRGYLKNEVCKKCGNKIIKQRFKQE